jgi:hypothetical protein
VTSNASFIRKVAYIVVIALLLIPLSLMSRPTTVRKDADGRMETRPGGTLSQMRIDAGLSQAQLGDIDPASETMKLATFGMRGVAVVLLWDRANEFKKTEDWDNLSATLEQIARLQPNFISVWEHQAHNMSYNVSVEFDDYKQRYHWVKKGIDYLMTGTEFNRNEPRLLWYTGWVVGQKMGRSDERVQFRRMFRDDKELHSMFARRGIDVESAKGADGKPDNWLVGRLWYLRGTHAVDNLGKSLGGKSPGLFYSSPIMSRINYASDSEKDEPVDWERTRAEWGQSNEEWTRLGDRPLPTSGGFSIRLNDVERLETQIREDEEKLDELLPGMRKAIREEKLAALPPDLRKALEKHTDDRNATEHSKAFEANQMINVTNVELAERAPAEKRLEAQRIAQRLFVTSERLRYTHTNRQVVNFDFWSQRSASGATELSSNARQHLIEARQLYARPDLEGAKEKFEQSFHEFAEVFKRWPSVAEDAENEDLVAAVENQYIKVLEQLDLRDASGGVLPPDFPLAELLRDHGKENLLKFRQESEDPAKPEARAKPEDGKTTDPAPQESTSPNSEQK